MKSCEFFLLSVVLVAIVGGCSQDTAPNIANKNTLTEPAATATPAPKDPVQVTPEPVPTVTPEPADPVQIPSEPVPTVTPEPEDYNAIAFRRARQAAIAAMRYNWSTANTILETIDVDRITDIETVAYVDYSKRCARVAQDIGVSTKSNPNSVANTVANLDWTQFIATVWTTIENKGLPGTAQLVVDAKRVRDEIPMWKKLDAKLTARYETK